MLALQLVGDPTSPPADIDSTTFAFTPNFVSATTPPSNSGVKVNTGNGVVTVDAARPAPPRLQTFVIEATVKTRPPALKTLGPIPIRICVHDAITDFWLTPGLLTVRQHADDQQFTVLAEFDDGTVGDITDRAGITWAVSRAADLGKVAFSATGRMNVTVASGTIDIQATHAGLMRKAQVKAEKPWATPTVATLVPGSAGVAKMTRVPNIIFLSEGFTAAEKPKFEALVKAIVRDLQSNENLRPFDLLKDAVNYFMAFVPSRERGCSALYAMKRVRRRTLFGEQIPEPAPKAAAPLTLPNLIYAVGLPSRADATVSALSARANWLVMYGLTVSVGFTDPDYPSVRKWQDRLTPLWARLAGGCHLNRAFDTLLEAADFEPVTLDRGYGQGPRAMNYLYKGVAVPAAA